VLPCHVNDRRRGSRSVVHHDHLEIVRHGLLGQCI
jgi:hypothetical protein